MREQEKGKNYKQKYNEEHYRQVNMRVSTELADKFNRKKESYGSAPKLLEASLAALEEVESLKFQLEEQNKRIEDFRANYHQLERAKKDVEEECERKDVYLQNVGIVDFILFRYFRKS